MNCSISEFEIDSYIKDENGKKKNIYKMCFMFSCFLMLAGVVGIILIFRLAGNMEYRKPIDDLFTEAETEDYSKISDILFPGLPEYLEIFNEHNNQFLMEMKNTLSEYVAYRVDKTDKLSAEELDYINLKLVECTNRKAETAYKIKVVIEKDSSQEPSITTDIVVGYYEQKWYIVSMSNILDI